MDWLPCHSMDTLVRESSNEPVSIAADAGAANVFNALWRGVRNVSLRVRRRSTR
jgi:hypothetical protein